MDPWSTEVKWETLKIISETEAIDVWYLFPLVALQRMLPKNGEIICRSKLNSLLGCNDWENIFYRTDIDLFGETHKFKRIDTIKLTEYIIKRLGTIFPAVAQNPRILYNSKESPLFLFCFAVSNKNSNAQKIALKIANDVLEKGK